jgi:hypothetical protein
MSTGTSSQDELRLLYEVTVTDLSYFKTQQWAVANYCMLSYAALVGIANILRPELRRSDRVVLILFALAACGASLFVLNKLQRSVGTRQSRLDALRENMHSEFVRAWSAQYKPQERLHAAHMLLVAVPATCALVAWLIGVRL